MKQARQKSRSFFSAFLEALPQMFSLAPQPSQTGEQLRKAYEELKTWNDANAIRHDFMAVGNDLEKAMRKYPEGGGHGKLF